MKIYVITAGEYSDYRIVCVFTDKDKAEHFVNLHNDYASKYSWADEYEIEEYDSKDEEYSIDDAGLMYSYAPYQIAYGATGAVRVVTRAEYERIKANDPNHIYIFLPPNRANESIARKAAYDEKARRDAEQAGIV